VVKVLEFWINCDVENLFRIKSGIHQIRLPSDYVTNKIEHNGWTIQGGRFREDSLKRARNHLIELIGLIAKHHCDNKDMVNAAIYLMALRQLSSIVEPNQPYLHATSVHSELNKIFGMEDYMFQACDSLLKIVKDELARHGIVDVS